MKNFTLILIFLFNLFIFQNATSQTLQVVTQNGNTTNRVIQITAQTGVPTSNAGLELFSSNGGDGSIQAFDRSAGTAKHLRIAQDGGDTYINQNAGNVLIGKISQVNKTYKLDVAGNVRANKIVVNTSGADFVFELGYKLPSLQSVEAYINQYKHLPGIDSAKQMQNDGLDVGEMNTKLLQKVEELTLYVIELQNQNKQIKEELKKLSDKK